MQGVECYWMFILPLPCGVIDLIYSLYREFIWTTKHPPIAWKGLCRPKEEGGIDLRDLKTWNLALLCHPLVSNQLNRLYSKFLKRNPGYDGKVGGEVSLYGHSLGSVLSYDILCHQEDSSAPCCMDTVLVKESKVDVSCQTTESNVSMKYENSSTKTRSAADPLPYETLEDSFISYPYSTINHGTQDLSISEDHIHAKDMQEVFSDNDDIMDPEEDFDDLDHLYFKGGESSTGVLRTSVDSDAAAVRDARFQTEDKVDTFFAVGSPLGVFLALRNVRIGVDKACFLHYVGNILKQLCQCLNLLSYADDCDFTLLDLFPVGRGQDYWQNEKITEEMPACRQMLNIFHPFDPVAYRVEPLICKECICRRPEFAEEVAMHSQIVKNQINSLRVNIVSMFQSQNKDKNKDTLDACKENERSYGSIMMEKLTDTEDGRVDHALQSASFSNYWRDKDTALFILNHLYRDILEEPPLSGDETTNPSAPGSLREPITLFYERDIIAEETPLTFSDSYSIKEFSRKAKKILTSR
ncbi:hypothetical protein ZIOFF_016064 [Zingiber officinale]|uniref:DDHD domain-containing protein n=1 Tax=Zingiber officinale TaxID=94328 RepID=A0A8J5I270_ZINOF|nr:hypothetical protein ZIOFF_016064 [Zingiber officinale]